MSLTIDEFLLLNNVNNPPYNATYYLAVMDNKGNLIYTDYTYLGNNRFTYNGEVYYAATYNNIKYNVGDILFFISTEDTINYYISNIYLLYQSLPSNTVLYFIYNNPNLNTTPYIQITTAYTQYNLGALSSVNQYIINNNVTARGVCNSPNYLLGDITNYNQDVFYDYHLICVSNDILSLINSYNPPQPQPTSDSNNYWVWILIGVIALIIILVIVIVVIIISVNNKKKNKQSTKVN